jgi:anti-sigma factor RsiW
MTDNWRRRLELLGDAAVAGEVRLMASDRAAVRAALAEVDRLGAELAKWRAIHGPGHVGAAPPAEVGTGDGTPCEACGSGMTWRGSDGRYRCFACGNAWGDAPASRRGVEYGCGCVASGDNVSSRCPVHFVPVAREWGDERP